jgi:hypothetical protein
VILGPDPRDWPEAASAFLAEREAQREVQGKWPRARAEALAIEDVRRWYAGGGDEAMMRALGANKYPGGRDATPRRPAS